MGEPHRSSFRHYLPDFGRNVGTQNPHVTFIKVGGQIEDAFSECVPLLGLGLREICRVRDFCGMQLQRFWLQRAWRERKRW